MIVLFSSLKNAGVSEKDYQRAVKVWKVFKIKNLGQFSDLYVKIDVLLLSDVYEKCISLCLENYGLDPSHYFNSPGLSWDAMLKMTGVKLEKINNINVHLFLEKGMSGGVSYISKRYSKSDEGNTILYLDINNLYGTVMSFYNLPCESYKFLSKKEINDFKLDSIPENILIGYILEVDLEYPKELHDYIMIILYVLKKLKLVMICCLNILKTLLIAMV